MTISRDRYAAFTTASRPQLSPVEACAAQLAANPPNPDADAPEGHVTLYAYRLNYGDESGNDWGEYSAVGRNLPDDCRGSVTLPASVIIKATEILVEPEPEPVAEAGGLWDNLSETKRRAVAESVGLSDAEAVAISCLSYANLGSELRDRLTPALRASLNRDAEPEPSGAVPTVRAMTQAEADHYRVSEQGWRHVSLPLIKRTPEGLTLTATREAVTAYLPNALAEFFGDDTVTLFASQPNADYAALTLTALPHALGDLITLGFDFYPAGNGYEPTDRQRYTYELTLTDGTRLTLVGWSLADALNDYGMSLVSFEAGGSGEAYVSYHGAPVAATFAEPQPVSPGNEPQPGPVRQPVTLPPVIDTEDRVAAEREDHNAEAVTATVSEYDARYAEPRPFGEADWQTYSGAESWGDGDGPDSQPLIMYFDGGDAYLIADAQAVELGFLDYDGEPDSDNPAPLVASYRISLPNQVAARIFLAGLPRDVAALMSLGFEPC